MSTYSSLSPYLSPNPLLGGSLNTGPTGLGGLSLNGQLVPVQSLPYANPLFSPGTLASRVPSGIGASAARSALNLMPAATTAPSIGARLTGALPSIAEGATFRGVAGRAIPGAIAGSIGSSLIDQTNLGGQNSNLEQGLQGAALGAGVGAAIGSPLFGIGALPGAAIGGLVGGVGGVVSNIFGGGGGGEDKATPLETLTNAISTAQLDDQTADAILQTYATQLAVAGGLEGDAREAARTEAFNTATAMVMAALQQQQAQAAQLQQAPAQAANTLALQEASQRIFQPLADNLRSTADAYSTTMGSIRDTLPAEYRGIADAAVARETAASNKLADAYMAQAALTPVVNQLTQYQQDHDAFANQLWSQMLAQQAALQSGAGGGGQVDLASLLAG